MLNKCQRAYSANARKLIHLMSQRHTDISSLFKTTRKKENSIKQNEHAKTNWLNIFTYIKSETQYYGFFFLHYFQRIDTQLYRTGIAVLVTHKIRFNLGPSKYYKFAEPSK